jgi:hypothetical protein
MSLNASVSIMFDDGLDRVCAPPCLLLPLRLLGVV